MADKLAGIDIPELPEGCVPLEVVAVVKHLDEQGEPTISIRVSEGLMSWEAIGMLITASDMARADLQSDLAAPWDEEEGDDAPE